MRKIAAILLLSIFFFNLFGYRLMISIMMDSADQSLEYALDRNDYDEHELISIKKPVNLPYYNNSKDFTRAFGEVEMDGAIYTYVKTRIINDSIEMLCIPNKAKEQLQRSKDDYTGMMLGLQKETNKKPSPVKTISFGKVINEYEENKTWSLGIHLLPGKPDNNTIHIPGCGILYTAKLERPPADTDAFVSPV